jgi:hypothetical protein
MIAPPISEPIGSILNRSSCVLRGNIGDDARQEFDSIKHENYPPSLVVQVFFRCQTAPLKYSYMLGGILSSCASAMCLRTVSEYWKRSPQMRQSHWSRAKMYGRHSGLFGSSFGWCIFKSAGDQTEFVYRETAVTAANRPLGTSPWYNELKVLEVRLSPFTQPHDKRAIAAATHRSRVRQSRSSSRRRCNGGTMGDREAEDRTGEGP